jgi:hypothetical protein
MLSPDTIAHEPAVAAPAASVHGAAAPELFDRIELAKVQGVKLAPSVERCDHCGASFAARNGTGGERQRFCGNACRRSYHKGHRPQPIVHVATVSSPPSPRAPATLGVVAESSKAEPIQCCLLAAQGLITVERDEWGNLVLRQDNCQNRWQEDESVILIHRDYEAQFLAGLADFVGHPPAAEEVA